MQIRLVIIHAFIQQIMIPVVCQMLSYVGMPLCLFNKSFFGYHQILRVLEYVKINKEYKPGPAHL